MKNTLRWLLPLLLFAGAGETLGLQEEGPPKDAVKEYCPGGVFEGPQAFYQPEPPGGVLWELCSGRRLGRVMARLDVDEAGRVGSMELLRGSGCPAVDAEIERCWSKWRYKPAQCNGEPVPVRVYFYKDWSRDEAPSPTDSDYCPSFEEWKEKEDETSKKEDSGGGPLR